MRPTSLDALPFIQHPPHHMTVQDLRRDIITASRTLWRHPAYSITAVVALSLAIAVNTTMFSVLDAMLHPASGARDPEQLYSLRYWGKIGKRSDVSWREQLVGGSGRTYQATSGAARAGLYMTGSAERGGVLREVAPMLVMPNYFSMLGIGPLEGTLSPSSDRTAATASVIISDRLRSQFFRAGEPVIGQSIVVDGRPLVITGVVRRFPGLSHMDGDVWMFAPPGRNLAINIVRLRPGITQQAASAEFSLMAAQLAIAEGEDRKETRFALDPMKQQFEVKRFHWALIGSAIAVLIVACTNLANLQLARGIGRASELALRAALGATRRRIVEQLMIESAVLAAVAMIIAIVLAMLGNALVRATIPPGIGEYVIEPQSSWRTVAFAGGAAVVSLILVGLIPALRASRVDLNSLIKSRAGTGAHRTNRRTYGALVITQIALTLPLVCAAVLVSRSLLRMTAASYLRTETVGFDTRPLIIMSILFPNSPDTVKSYADRANTLVSRARAVPGVADAAMEFSHGMTGGAVTVIDEAGAMREINANSFGYKIVTPSYFRTLGLPMERGSDFPDGIPDEGSVITNRGTAWYLWPHLSPKGRMIKLGAIKTNAPWVKMQGVVGDYLSEEARERQRGEDTLRLTQIVRVLTTRDSISSTRNGGWMWTSVIVRARDNPQVVASALRRAFYDVTTRPPRVLLWEEEAGIPQRIAIFKFIAALFTTFGALALGLSGLGVYGIVAQSVSDRKREVAVRIALGSTPRNIIYVLIRQGNVLVLAGVAIGLYMSKETVTWLDHFVGEVDLTNAILFGLLCIGLFSAMVGSALIPAIRATQIDPMNVLRAE